MRFASENTQGKPLDIHSTSDEISDLAASISTMEQDMMRYIENLTAATAEREHIRAELALASTIQESAIPNTFPAFPERTNLDIYGSMSAETSIITFSRMTTIWC